MSRSFILSSIHSIVLNREGAPFQFHSLYFDIDEVVIELQGLDLGTLLYIFTIRLRSELHI